MRRFIVTVAAALMVTPHTIAHTMVMGTQRTARGTIGLMRTRPTTQCIGIIDPFTLTPGTPRGFIGRCMQRTGHIIVRCLQRTGRFIVPWRMGAHARCFPERCG